MVKTPKNQHQMEENFMKSYEEFKTEVKANIKGYLPENYAEAAVEEQKITKPNEEYDGLTARTEGQRVTAVVNLNWFYAKRYLKRLGENPDEAAVFDSVLEDMAKIILKPTPFSADGEDLSALLFDYEKVKPKLFLRVCNAEKNERAMKDVPKKVFGDIAVACYIKVSDDGDGMSCTKVDKKLLDIYGITSMQLFDDAQENAKQMAPMVFENLAVHMGLPQELAEDMPLYIVTTKNHNVGGAAALFYDGAMGQVAEALGGNFVALPSSTDEFLVVADDGRIPYEEFQSMVRGVNVASVPADMVLSDNAYRYDADTKTFEQITQERG